MPFYQQTPLFKNIQASALCFTFFASNQIPPALCTCPLSPECAFGATQTCQHEDTVRSFTQSRTSILATSFTFLLAPLTAYQKYALSLCLFFANVGLSWKTGHYACVSLDHASASVRPDEGGLKLTEPDKWPRVPGGPHTAFWPTATEPEWQLGHLKATT